ncbi:PLP-dependent aspartate aminotransferase family protein [Sediminibacterium sp.]|uniref:trans-sulfuration enzyme family protein n=1 Tax=Sediminibacterium sp. TaxID=1917865 RepID=UPI0025F90B15|nr:PLP-dependent aspartate aminotransferase family protein [Sediminibacterium sp.]MBT9483902.1 PLP-dependent transferase [Sediminibacterium sp.]
MLSATQLIHSIPVDPLTGAISVPIYQTSTFVQEAPGVNKGYDYSRSNNPTRATLEELMAKLEFGATGLAFASGLAAIDAVVKLLKSGDEIVAVDDIYGGAYRLFTAVYEQYGIKVHFVDTSDLEKVAAAITPNTNLIWLETPTNPTLKISDISAIAKIAKANNCLLCVDNTFATPVLQQPLLLGADIVIHSATKYLGGHSDLIAGILVAKDEQVGARLKFFQNACGAVLAPFDSWLVIRGIETLHLRMKHHSRTALKVAQYLTIHPAIAEVYYPGLSTHANHELALTQSKTGGGIISFSLVNDSNDAAVDIVSNTQLFKLAESLGGIKSLISHPANMTHKSIPVEKRRAAGVSDSLIRLSIGLEEAEDLIADLASVLDSIEAKESSDAYATSNEY